MKTVVSGKRTVEYVKPSKRELENELMDYLNTKGVHIDKDVWDETVDYILSFWDEQDYKPRDTYEAINDWYNDTKKFFPEMFGKGRKVASARYLRWIKNQKLIKSAKTKKVNKRKTADERAKDEGADITCSRKPIKSATGYSIEDYDPNISLSDNLYYQNPNVKPGLNSEMSFHLLDYAMEQGVPYDECKDWTYREWQDFVRSKSPKITNSRKNQKIKNSYNCNRSKRMIKSSRNEKTMQAYDTADYIYENIMNRGQMYDKWFINKPQYAQDAAYICVEHTDFSVRLWFEFTNTDFCYVTGYFTNGSSYDKQVIDSWSYGGFETALNDVKSYLDNFFEIGGGLDSLRQKLGE